MMSAEVTIGIANAVRNAVTSIIHVNTGIRMRVMPGARMLKIVTMRLIADVVDPMPSMMSPTDQKSGPRPGRNPELIGALLSDAYPNQPPLGAPPSRKLE